MQKKFFTFAGMKKFIKYQTFLLLASSLLINTSLLFTSCKRNDPIDTTLPTNLSLTASEITQTSMKISLSATDNTSVGSMGLYNNATKSIVKTFTGSTGNYILSGLTPNTEYSFYITATDVAGNTAKSQVFTFKTLDETFTAVVDASTSFEGSTTAVDKVLLGGSIAKAFVLNMTNAGTAKVEVLGSTTNDLPAVAYYWINGADNSDINISCSTLNSKVAKTAITSTSFTINLQAGVNVICFKTARYSGKINNGGEVGLKMTFSNAVFKTIGYTADAVSANVAAIQKQESKTINNVNFGPNSETVNDSWGIIQLTPYSDENASVYDGTLYPKILGLTLSTTPEWSTGNTNGWNDLDFKNTQGIGGRNFRMTCDNNGTGVILFTDNNSLFSLNKLQFQSSNSIQITKSILGNYAMLVYSVNVFNTSSTAFGPANVSFVYQSVHFVGNPETWIYNTSGVRIQ